MELMKARKKHEHVQIGYNSWQLCTSCKVIGHQNVYYNLSFELMTKVEAKQNDVDQELAWGVTWDKGNERYSHTN